MTLNMEAAYGLSSDRVNIQRQRSIEVYRIDIDQVGAYVDISGTPSPHSGASPPLLLAGALTQGPSSPQFDAPSCDPLWLYLLLPDAISHSSYSLPLTRSSSILTSALQPSSPQPGGDSLLWYLN